MDDARMDRADATKFVKRAVVAELYRQGSASIGSCSENADITLEDFIRYLVVRKISVFHFDSPESFDRKYVAAAHLL